MLSETEPATEDSLDHFPIELLAVETEHYISIFQMPCSLIERILIVDVESTRGGIPQDEDGDTTVTALQIRPPTNFISELFGLYVEHYCTQS